MSQRCTTSDTMSYNHLTMQELVSYDVLYGVTTVRPAFIIDLVS
jgi:hypothetical protein